MRRFLSLPLLLAILVLSACDGPPKFSSPISEPGAAPYDERLAGRWCALTGDREGVVFLTIAPGEEGFIDATLGAMGIEPGIEGEATLTWFQSTAYASAIDGNIYYNLRPLG
jgi:hypothetical protein